MRYVRDMLDGLDRAGFKRDLGMEDTGIILLAWQKCVQLSISSELQAC